MNNPPPQSPADRAGLALAEMISAELLILVNDLGHEIAISAGMTGLLRGLGVMSGIIAAVSRCSNSDGMRLVKVYLVQALDEAAAELDAER